MSDAPTGVAVAIASIGVSPKPSKVLGQTTTSAVRYAVTMSVSVRSDSMLQVTPRVAASRSRDARSGPFPMMRTGVFGSTRAAARTTAAWRSEEHTSELQSHLNLVCRLLLEKKNFIDIRLSSYLLHRHVRCGVLLSNIA